MASPAIPQIDLNPTIGVDFIGLILSAVFYGITSLQSIFYYRTYPKDRATLKFMVAVLWALDTLSLALVAHGVYTYLVLDFANPIAVGAFVWSISSEPAATSVVGLIVHEFLVYRIYALNPAWLPLAAILAVYALLPFSLGIVAVWRINTGNTALESVTNELHWIAITADVNTSALDLIIAFAICFLLYRSRSKFAPTERIINLLTLYVITSGLITTALNMAVLISFLAAPGTLIFQLFNMSVSKAYVNTLLATLNMRQSIRGRGTTTTMGTMPHALAFAETKASSDDATAADTRQYEIPISETTASVNGALSMNDDEHVFPVQKQAKILHTEADEHV